MVERTGICEGCAVIFAAPGRRGRMPRCCPSCTQDRRRRYEQEWAAARPRRVTPERAVRCGDCDTEFLWSGRGVPPGRCKLCTEDRRRRANRERGRIRRAAAKVGDARRRGVCTECFGEFEGPSRGAIPQRCPRCTKEWNRVRYKVSANRPETSRRRHLLVKYGISVSDWDEMFDRQGGRCAICQLPEEEVGGRLHVDHCHTTGSVRGLLCQGCNTGIGKLREDPGIIRNAAAYVERSMVKAL